MKKNFIIVVLLIIAVVAVMAIKNSKDSTTKGKPSETTSAMLAVEKTIPRMLDLGADKCIPCKAMAPILDEMKETFEGSLDVEFIDVWKYPDLAKPYNIRIIPTQIFFDADGKELFRHEGFFAQEDMLAKWKELGFDFENGE